MNSISSTPPPPLPSISAGAGPGRPSDARQGQSTFTPGFDLGGLSTPLIGEPEVNLSVNVAIEAGIRRAAGNARRDCTVSTPSSFSCPRPSASAAPGIGDRALQALAGNGGSIRIVFDRNLDNAQYAGNANGAGDAAGTLLLQRGAEYTVRTVNGRSLTAGFNEGDGRYVDGAEYGGYDQSMLGERKVNMWGRGMSITPDGQVVDPEYGVVGHVAAATPGSGSASASSCRPGSSAGGAPGIGDLALQALASEAGRVKIVFDKDYDDARYQANQAVLMAQRMCGHPAQRDDPAGTLLLQKGAEYTIRTVNGRSLTAGFNEGDGRYVDGAKYGGYDQSMLGERKVNMWGRGMSITPDGQVVDPEYGAVGHVVSVG